MQADLKPHKLYESPFLFIIGFVMAGIGGYINVSMLSLFQVPVSHMTGPVSRLGVDIGVGNIVDFNLIFAIVLFFLLGTIISGTTIGSVRLRPGRRYGVLLMLEGILISMAAHLAALGNYISLPLGALACGIQNGMVGSYYHTTLRSTHVTGIITDLGILIGHCIRRHKVEHWRIALLISILIGFFSGGLASMFVVNNISKNPLWIAAVILFVGGGTYSLWRHSKKKSHV